VHALNLIEIEFNDDPKVMSALRALMDHFGTGYGRNKTIDELNAANEKSDALRTSLLSAMANDLGYKFEQMDIHRGGYLPEGWGTELNEQAVARRGLAELLSGRRTLPVFIAPTSSSPVTDIPQQQTSPFPPKPGG